MLKIMAYDLKEYRGRMLGVISELRAVERRCAAASWQLLPEPFIPMVPRAVVFRVTDTSRKVFQCKAVLC